MNNYPLSNLKSRQNKYTPTKRRKKKKSDKMPKLVQEEIEYLTRLLSIKKLK